MEPIVILGWVCAVMGTASFLPQPIKLYRDRNTAGLSLRYWQLAGGSIAGWASHGFLVNKMNILVPNVIVVIGVAFTLWLIMDTRKISWAATFWLPILLGVVLVGIELTFGEAAFGLAAALPGVIGVIAQFLDILRSPDVSGVSGWALALSVLMQALWLIWGWLYPDVATAISASIMTVLFSLTFGWFLARKAGLRPHFLRV